MGGKNLKSVNHYKYLGAVLDIALRWQRHSETTAMKILCSKQGGCQGAQLPPQNFACPPQWPPKIFLVTSCHCTEVLHRPLTAPLVAKLAPPVAPPKWKCLPPPLAANKLRASFSRCSRAVKNVLFRSFCTPMFASHGGISESHACKDCVWPIILDAELYTTCPGERVLVVMTHQVQYNIPAFQALLRKNIYFFRGRCRRSNNVWLPALTQSDCLYTSLFFEHCNRILLCA